MSSGKKDMVKVSLKYGLTGGGVFIVLFVVLYFTNEDPLLYAGLIDAVIMLIFLIFAMKEFRDLYHGGVMKFAEGMSIGIMCYLIMALISAVFVYIMTAIVDPNLLSHYIDTRMAMIREHKEALTGTIDRSAYLRSLAGVRGTTAFDLALDDFFKKSITGLIITIAIAVIFRKQQSKH